MNNRSVLSATLKYFHTWCLGLCTLAPALPALAIGLPSWSPYTQNFSFSLVFVWVFFLEFLIFILYWSS